MAEAMPSHLSLTEQQQPSQHTKRSIPALIAKSLLVALCVSVLPLAPHPSRKFTTALPNAVREAFPHHATISWAKFPGRRDLQSMMQSLSWSSSAKKSFSSESSWERTELAWDSLGYNIDVLAREDHRTVLEKALDGLAQFLFPDKRKKRSNNVRRKKQSIHRRLKSIDGEYNHGGEETENSLLSNLKNYPLAASVLVIVGMISIVASFIASSDQRRLARMASRYNYNEGRNGGIVVDEEEAEILEFYEKEMEAGSFRRMLSFDYDKEDDLGVEVIRANNGSFESEGSLDLRDDAVYTQVLLNDGGSTDCQEDVFDTSEENESKQELVAESKSEVSSGVVDTDALHQESSQDDFYDCESNQSPQQSLNESMSSSISSLTSEVYQDDINASFSFSSDEGSLHNSSDTLVVTDSYQQLPPAMNQTGSPLHSETEGTIISATADTPLIKNLFRYCKTRYGDDPRPKLERRVSFNPEVKVKEIPRREVDDQFSSEKYLYFMLFLVGVVIAVFSFLPVHPSLSPIASMTRKEVLRRADTLLNAQWDVEL
ncbi:hypothetical protein ACHAWO_009472 [Cyclotella atomus]|uniref:Uncharacterized protein n=1 Tax=Cyclotella atomus TaxID=382360 RepID=A0ABD3PVX1_9STRA